MWQNFDAIQVIYRRIPNVRRTTYLLECARRRPRSRRRGFSLVELMTVMIILAMLSGLAIVAYNGFADNARESTVRTEMATLVQALSAFQLVNGRYPTNDEGLAILKKPAKNFPQGYLSKIPKDPWGTPFVYISPGSKGPFEIISLGEDKKEGGEKAKADISSNSIEYE